MCNSCVVYLFITTLTNCLCVFLCSCCQHCPYICVLIECKHAYHIVMSKCKCVALVYVGCACSNTVWIKKKNEGKACSDCNGLWKQWPDRSYKYFRCSVLAPGQKRQQEDPRCDVSHHCFTREEEFWCAAKYIHLNKSLILLFRHQRLFVFLR